VSSFGRGLELSPTVSEVHYAGDDLVRILSRLSQDVEQFDSMIQTQRHRLQKHGVDPWPLDDAMIRRYAKRMRAEANEMVTRALSALEELNSLGYAGERQHNGGEGGGSAGQLTGGVAIFN
jgi:hypothetical protein